MKIRSSVQGIMLPQRTLVKWQRVYSHLRFTARLCEPGETFSNRYNGRGFWALCRALL